MRIIPILLPNVRVKANLLFVDLVVFNRFRCVVIRKAFRSTLFSTIVSTKHEPNRFYPPGTRSYAVACKGVLAKPALYVLQAVYL